MTVKFIHLRGGQYYLSKDEAQRENEYFQNLGLEGLEYEETRPGLQGTPHPYSGFTIAYDFFDNHVEYAVAECSPKDRYNKKIGRAIAQGRLATKPVWVLPIAPTESITSQILTHFWENYSWES